MRFCEKHTRLMIEVKKRGMQKSTASPSTPPSPNPTPASPTAPNTPSAGGTPQNVPTGKRVQRGHRKQIEVVKRKIARRAKPP